MTAALLSRDDVAKWLAARSGIPAACLLVSNDDVRIAYDLAIERHGADDCCSWPVRLRWARDVLLGRVEPVQGVLG